jgi:predicted nucleic acid-binding protein
LERPYFTQSLVEQDRAAFLALVSGVATIVEITAPVPDAVSDPADNLVLATALSARVPYLVSGDRELQRLDEYRGLIVLSPAAFLADLDDA